METRIKEKQGAGGAAGREKKGWGQGNLGG